MEAEVEVEVEVEVGAEAEAEAEAEAAEEAAEEAEEDEDGPVEEVVVNINNLLNNILLTKSIKSKMMSSLYDCDSRNEYDDHFGIKELINEKEKDALNEMQLKIDSNAKDQKERLEVFASLLNESIVKQNEENGRFRQSISYAVNTHLQTFLQSLEPAQEATKETVLILKNAVDVLRLSKLSSEKLASLVQPLLSSHSFLEQEVIQLNKRVKTLESSMKELTDLDSFLITPPPPLSNNQPNPIQLQLQQQQEPKSKRKSPSS